MLEWAESQPRTGDTLNTLQFHLAQLGYVQEAVAVQKEAITVSGTAGASMKVSSLLTLVRLERRAGDFPGALHALQEAESVLPADKNGLGQGLWRHYVNWSGSRVYSGQRTSAGLSPLALNDRCLRHSNSSYSKYVCFVMTSCDLLCGMLAPAWR
jgi:hypothetical protein